MGYINEVIHHPGEHRIALEVTATGVGIALFVIANIGTFGLALPFIAMNVLVSSPVNILASALGLGGQAALGVEGFMWLHRRYARRIHNWPTIHN